MVERASWEESNLDHFGCIHKFQASNWRLDAIKVENQVDVL